MEAIYELAKSPPTHDFVNWLARAEYMRRASMDPHLQVRVVAGQRDWSDRDKQYSVDRREWRIENLLLPLARLVPSVNEATRAVTGTQVLSYANPGRPVPPIFKAPRLAREIVAEALPNNVVTITLRDSDFERQRNTRFHEWLKVADWLDGQGFTPVFVPDAEAHMRGLNLNVRHPVYTPASHNVALRLALFEHARMNLMTNSGIMVLALHSEINMMAFRLFVADVLSCSVAHMKRSGFSPDHNWGPGKKTYWEEDYADDVIGVLKRDFKG
jgi:hypothetical protein